jgi:hypothetical protein
MSAGCKVPLQVDFLRDIYYTQARLEFEALEEVALPPFAGSALRGVLGHALRDNLCDARPLCNTGCMQPETCHYYALFERNRESDEGSNLPKSLILDPPVPLDLEQIALGAPPRFPYEVNGAGRSLPPKLMNRNEWRAPAGCEFAARITLLGQAGALLPALIRVLQQSEMRIGGGLFQLSRAVDTAQGGRVLWDRAEGFPSQAALRQDFAGLLLQTRSPQRLLVGFVTPVRLRTGTGRYCFSPRELAQRFWEAALVRAMRVRDTFCKLGERLPWMELPITPEFQTKSFYQYVLPRLSHRQQAFMDFDGLIGTAEYTAPRRELVALAQAAEVLHVGQKATFGLGRVRCIDLDGH